MNTNGIFRHVLPGIDVSRCVMTWKETCLCDLIDRSVMSAVQETLESCVMLCYGIFMLDIFVANYLLFWR